MHVPIRVMSSEALSAQCVVFDILNIVVSLDKSASANSAATQRIPTSSLCSYGQDSETYRPFYGSEEYGSPASVTFLLVRY